MSQDDAEFVAARQFEQFANDLLDMDYERAEALLQAFREGRLILDPAKGDWREQSEIDLEGTAYSVRFIKTKDQAA